MANEITVTAKLQVSKGDLVDSMGGTAKSITMTNAKALKHIQNVGITEEVLNLGDIAAANLGWIWMKNLDATNFVKVRPSTGAADLIRLNAGEEALFRFATGITPYVIADTAACNLQYQLLET